MVGRGDDHQRHRPVPPADHVEQLVGLLLAAVDQHRVRPRVGVGPGPVQGLVRAPARDQGLDPRDDHELGAGLGRLRPAHLVLELGHRDQGVGTGAKLLSFGKHLSSTHTPATPARSNRRTMWAAFSPSP